MAGEGLELPADAGGGVFDGEDLGEPIAGSRGQVLAGRVPGHGPGFIPRPAAFYQGLVPQGQAALGGHHETVWWYCVLC